MKILVTGGAGFIGSEFVRQAVRKRYEIIVVDSLTYAGDMERLKEVEGAYKFYKINIRDYRELKKVFESEKPQIVVHFAAESHVDRSIMDPFSFIKTNVEGTLNLLELSKEYGKWLERFINISTDEVYGDLGEKGMFTEESPLKPNSPYSASKAAADMLGRAYHRTYGLPIITVRPSNNYGPWQYPEKFIPVVIVKAIKDEPIPIYGTGLNVREWLYVEDCADAVLRIMEKGKVGEVYNVASGNERRNLEVAQKILDILGKPRDLITFVEDRPGHDYRYAMDWNKVKNELGWKPKTDFERGIRKTISWFLANFDWVERKITFLRDYWDKIYR